MTHKIILFTILITIISLYPINAAFFHNDIESSNPDLYWSVDTVCQSFHENMYADRAWGDGNCDGVNPDSGHPDILPAWYHPDNIFNSSLYHGNNHTPEGTQLGPGFVGDVMQMRKSNHPESRRFSIWSHRSPDGTPTCPIQVDETLCVPDRDCIDEDMNGLCDSTQPTDDHYSQHGDGESCIGTFAITYTSIGDESLREWRSQGTNRPNEPRPQNNQIAERAWTAPLAWKIPSSRYVVAGYNIATRRYMEEIGNSDLSYNYLYGSDAFGAFGADRHLTVSAYGCTGVPEGLPAILVDRVNILTTYSGNAWGCEEFAQYHADGMHTSGTFPSPTCWVGLGGGAINIPIEGIVAEGIDGQAVSQHDMRLFYDGLLPEGGVSIPPPPLPHEVPPGHMVEENPEFSRGDSGCLSEGMLFEINPWLTRCYSDSMHTLDQGTHHGDGKGWRHPSSFPGSGIISSLEVPRSVMDGEVSLRSSGEHGHLYPPSYLNCAPSPDFDGDGAVTTSDFVQGFLPLYTSGQCYVSDFFHWFLPAYRAIFF